MQLRPYQIEAVEAVYKYLRENDDNPCIVLPTAAGKTPCLATICKDAVLRWSGRVLILAHVKELLEQAAEKLEAICPEVHVGIYSAGLNRRDTLAPVIIAGIQSVYKRASDLGKFDLIVVDECFPAGTLISTPRGNVPIEDLYVGQPVHTALGVGEIECISARPASELITLELDNGKTITCTPNHLFFTIKGWLPAEALAVGTRLYNHEDLLAMRERIQAANLLGRQGDSETLYSRRGLEQEKLLLAPMCEQSQNKAKKQNTNPAENQCANMEWRSSETGSQDVSLLWSNDTSVDSEKKIRTNHISEQKIMGKDEILLNLLREESRESNVSTRYPGESKQKAQTNRTQTSNKRGQRTTINRSTTDVVEQAREGMGTGTCGADFRGTTQAWSGQLLQGGLGKSQKENRNTIRWGESSSQEKQTNRQTCNNMVGSIRVDRISHIKLNGQEIVYNLQVKGHPSYFANGALVHNCHLIAPEGEGMYQTFLSEMKEINPDVRLIGLTATPYRMKSGMICAPDNLLNNICYEIGVKELINQGYLCPLVSKAGRREADTDKLHIRAGEFIASEAEELMDEDNLVLAACEEIISYTRDRKSCLIFAAGINHAEHIAATLRGEFGVEAECVFGETSSLFREQYIEDFKTGKLKYLINVGVLTTGFDAPNIDCVVLLRPTNSPGLFYQMTGRGFRLHPDKENCLILDFGGNIMRHGPVDAISIKEPGKGNGEAPAKKCPECNSVIHAAYHTCPDCGYIFPQRDKDKHDSKAATTGIISGQVDYTDYDVKAVFYSVHIKRGADPEDPKTMRVEYCVGFNHYISEWVCPEHTGYARNKFEAWWKKHSNVPAPETAQETVNLANDGALAKPSKIIVKSIAGEKFDRIVDYELGPIPEYIPEPGWNDCEPYDAEEDYMEDDIPF